MSEQILWYTGYNIEDERKLFEDVIQYRHFLERHKDGTYKLEWVDGRWHGWLMCVQYRSIK